MTSVRGLAAYTVPKVDVLVSGIFRSQANAQPGADPGTNGASRTATYRMNAAQFLAATGRPLATGLATQDVNLVLQGDVYGDRVNNVDMRIAKVLRFGKYKPTSGLDVYNLTNSNTPTTYETVYRPGDERGSMDAAHRGAAAAVHAVQRAGRLLKSAAIGFVLATAVALSAAEKAAIPRTSDGHPDLQGTWSYATLTTLSALQNSRTGRF